MGVSWSEGLEAAEREAFRTLGKRHAWWFTWGKRLAPVLLVAAVLGALGWSLHWLAGKVAGVASGTSVHVPGGLILMLTAGLLVLTGLAVRGRAGHIRSFGALVLTGLAILTAWGAFALYVLGSAS